jgi:hypothetical protein
MESKPGTVIIARKTYPYIREFFIQKKINFIDQDGFARLFKEGITILLKEIDTEPERRQFTGRAFTKTGLKVVYHFLRYSESINQTMREIAESTNVGLDTVHNVVKDLQNQDLIIPESTGDYIYNDRKKIYDAWMEQYELKLQPSLQLGRFSFVDKSTNWKDLILPEDTSWGGEPAAAIIAGSLIPREFLIYTGLNIRKIIDILSIKPDINGPIIVNSKFWLNEPEFRKTTHPLLIYADLMQTHTTRNHEIGAIIYQEHLKKMIEQ